jgi:hypothetical protein
MRMWGVPTEVLCRSHLLGEHTEIHMLIGSIQRSRSIHGFTSTGLIDTRLIRSRHEELVEEMGKRGYVHSSPLADYPEVPPAGNLNVYQNLLELAKRCEKCRSKIFGNLFDGTPLVSV